MIPSGCGYVVLFWAKPKGVTGYSEAVARAREAAEQVPGFLGQNVVDGEDGSLSVIYWKDQKAMEVWRNHPVHREAKTHSGEYYFDYQVLHCQVVDG